MTLRERLVLCEHLMHCLAAGGPQLVILVNHTRGIVLAIDVDRVSGVPRRKVLRILLHQPVLAERFIVESLRDCPLVVPRLLMKIVEKESRHQLRRLGILLGVRRSEHAQILRRRLLALARKQRRKERWIGILLRRI